MNIQLSLRTALIAITLVCLPAAIAQPRVTAVVNGGSFQPSVSPSSFATIFGQGFASSALGASTATLPLDLGGVSVTVSGRPAPLFYVSATQINFQVPLATPPGQASVVVRVNGVNSPVFRFQVAAAAPGILAFGANQAVAQHLDGTLVTPEDPANPGMPAVIYLTGIGAVSNPVSDGAPAPLSPLSYASLPHSVIVGGKDAPVGFLGLTPGFIGLAQANITVPDLAPGDHPVILSAGGKQSSANAPVLAVDNAPTLQSVSSTAGLPGTRITLLGASLPSGTELRSVLVQFEDGGLVPAAPDFSSGQPTFYVPFIPDPEAPLGYRTGACTIAIYNGKTISNTLPFQIDVLPIPADAIGRLKNIVRGFANTSQRTLALQKAIPEFEPLADAIEPLSLARTNALLALADQVAANGRATVPFDLGGPLNVGAPTFEVTLRDVQNLIAVLDQAKPNGAQVAAVTLPPAQADGPKPCLFDLPGYQYCTILTQSPDAYGEGDDSGPLFRLLNHAFTVGPQIYNNLRVLCTFNRSAIAPTLVATHLLQYLNDRRLTCKLQPTKPVSLTALPVPNPIPAGSFESTGNRGTQINIRLEPFWTPEFTVEQILESRYTDTVLHAMPFPDQCLRDLGGDLGRMAGDIFSRARGQLLDGLKKLAPVPFREVPLYKCDVTDVQPSNGHPPIVRYRSDKNDDSTSHWGIEGTQSGTTRVAVHPIWDHFLPDIFAIDPSDHCPGVLGGPLKPGLLGDFVPSIIA